jgi:tetratricopeptide (TPR) repeat protein
MSAQASKDGGLVSGRHARACACPLHSLSLLLLLFLVFFLIAPSRTLAQGRLKLSYEQAQQLFEQGKNAQATVAFRALLVQTYQDRGGLYQQEGQWKEASADLQAALDLNPSLDKLRYDLAYTEFRTQHYQEAASLLKQLPTESLGTPRVHALLGKVYLSLGKLDLARRELQSAMRLNPQDHLTAYTLALADLTSKDQAGADQIFSYLEKSLGASPRFRVVVARAYSDTGYQQAARRELSRALTIDPKTRYAHYLMAIALLREKGTGGVEEAKHELLRETRLFPDEFEARYLFGVLLVFQRRWDDAGHALQKAVLLEPNQPETYYYLGEVYFGQKQLRQAADALRKGLLLAKSRDDTRFPFNRAHLLLSRVHRALGENEASLKEAREAESSFRAGPRKAGTVSGADARLRESLAGLASPSSTVTWKDPSPPVPLTAQQKHLLGIYGEVLVSAHNYLARIAVGEGNFKEAARQFAAVRSLQPNYPEVDFRLGLALFKGQEFSQAVKPLEDAIARNPADSVSAKYLGLTYFELGQYDNAVKQLERAQKSSPGDPEVLLALGGAFARTHREKQAQQVMAELLKSDPNSAGLHILLGRAYAAQGQTPQAEQEFRRALEINPQTPSAHLYLGILKMQDGKMEEAGKEFKAELQFNPNSVEARYDLAFALLKQQKTAEAIQMLRLVIQKKPAYSEAHYSLGKALLQQGEIQEAISELKEAVQLDPKKAYSHYQLGRAYMMVGKRQEARQQFELTRNLKDQELKFKVPQIANNP